jgi:hypothetical protein
MMPATVLDYNGLGQRSDVIGGAIWAAENGADVILLGFINARFRHARMGWGGDIGLRILVLGGRQDHQKQPDPNFIGRKTHVVPI